MYKSSKLVFTLAFVTYTILLTFAFAEDMERRQIIAVRVKTAPKIDGELDDPIWEKAIPSEGFTQKKPDNGEPMTQRTTIRILYDDENIYLGFQCYDSQPEKVIGTETRRDYHVWSVNDYIRFIFDTYHDLRSGYYFGTNPLGAQVDARIAGTSQFYESWDAVWDCAAARNPQGWSAEFSIPFRQLRFPLKDKHVWGFNCGRVVRRYNEDGCWSPVGARSVTAASCAGEILGLENISQGHKLEIRPAFVGGVEIKYHSETDVDSVKKPSLDLKYGISSGLLLDATINTDFAQMEADEERANLSRFDMSFEEKRPFFLEGVGIFDTPISLFYSRRIGSEKGKEVPILGGLKLTGKMGKQTLGLLNVQTDKMGEVSSTNFSAFRVQRDILKSSSAGIMFLNKSPWEGEEDNQTLGVDLRFKPTEELYMSGSLAKTWTEGLQGNDLAGQISGSLNTELTNLGFDFVDIQENFNPEMGFVTRRDIRRGEFRGGRKFMIRKSIFRSLRFGGKYQIGLNHDDRLQYRSVAGNAELEFETGEYLESWYERNYDYINKDWEIRKGIAIPAGMYKWNRYGVYANTNESRWLRIGGSITGGGFYTGDRQSFSMHGHIRPIPSLLITGDYRRNFVDLPDGNFTTNTINSRSIYSFSPDFFIKLFLQWNDDNDIVRGNLLLRYTYRPGSDLYIVYNELWRSNKVEQRSIVAKITYFLNL